MRKIKFLPFLLVFLVLASCENKNKTLVSAHKAVGELLIVTKDQTKLLHDKKVISDSTYNNIKINWIKAQTSYVDASDLLDSIIATDSKDVSDYLALITQINTILSDIAGWLQEESK